MKKVLLSMTMMAALFMTSCGGDASEEATGEANANSEEGQAEGNEADANADNTMSLCDCFEEAKGYESEEAAREGMGDATVDHCMELMKNATDEEMMDCMGMEAPEGAEEEADL